MSLVDIAPTLLELIDHPGAATLQAQAEGRSLVPALSTLAVDAAPVFAETGAVRDPSLPKLRRPEQIAARSRAVYLDVGSSNADHSRTGGIEWGLYDLAARGNEDVNVYRPDHEALPRLREALDPVDGTSSTSRR